MTLKAKTIKDDIIMKFKEKQNNRLKKKRCKTLKL